MLAEAGVLFWIRVERRVPGVGSARRSSRDLLEVTWG